MSDVDKQAIPTRLFWVDLEMTGLDARNDVILEVAAEITDFEFTKLASYEAIIRQPAEVVTDRMQQNRWWQNYPENRDEFIRKTSDELAAKPSAQVEAELVALIDTYIGDEPAILAGNSIHNDRAFIRHWWPTLDAALHYRMLDVSAWKVFMQGRYGLNYEKQDVHRAFEDIQASMAELQYYLDWFKSNAQKD